MKVVPSILKISKVGKMVLYKLPQSDMNDKGQSAEYVTDVAEDVSIVGNPTPLHPAEKVVVTDVSVAVPAGVGLNLQHQLGGWQDVNHKADEHQPGVNAVLQFPLALVEVLVANGG